MKKILMKIFSCFSNNNPAYSPDSISLNTIPSISVRSSSFSGSVNNPQDVIENTVSLGNRHIKIHMDSNTWFSGNPGSLFKVLGRVSESNINQSNNKGISNDRPFSLADNSKFISDQVRPDSPTLGNIDNSFASSSGVNLSDYPIEVDISDISLSHLNTVNSSNISLLSYSSSDSFLLSIVNSYSTNNINEFAAISSLF